MGLLLITLVLGLLIGLLLWRNISWDNEGVGIVGGLLILFLFLPLVISLIALAVVNGNGLAKWEVFAEVNTQNYQITIDKTSAILSVDKFESTLIAGSVEKIKQGEVISERIKEWRDEINKYNKTIASMKFYDSLWFTNILIPNDVQNLKYLKIE